MAFAFPRVRLVCVANRTFISLGQRLGQAKPPPQPVPRAFVGRGPLVPPSPRTPASARAAARPSCQSPAGAPGLGTRRWRWWLQVPGCLPSGARRTDTAPPPRPVLRAAAGVRARAGHAAEPPCRRPARCPPPGRRASRCPRSPGKQRPGAILGRGTDPRPRDGRSPGSFHDATARMGTPSRASVSGETPSPPWWPRTREPRAGAPGAGPLPAGGPQSSRPRRHLPPPPRPCVYSAGSLAKKTVDAVCICVCFVLAGGKSAEGRGTSLQPKPQFRRSLPSQRCGPGPSWAARVQAFCMFVPRPPAPWTRPD